ncbi:hypothetical protein ACHAXA_009985 [Cyclostephanos tholiformis]|uniref:SAP domain-containing protein n=1 Tax=Cyclostephanos tholiformis TaxID=382380 RepID=A0ABD3R1N4_9STRA
MIGEARGRMRRSGSVAWTCHYNKFEVHTARQNMLFLCIMLGIGHSMMLVSPMALSNYNCHRWTGIHPTRMPPICNKEQKSRSTRIRIGTTSSRKINALNSASKIISDACLEEDDFDDVLDKDGHSSTETKVSDDEGDDVSADEYFGRFISEALKDEEMNKNSATTKVLLSPISKDSSSSPDDGDVRCMIQQQQQQIDLLMKLVKQGRQQFPLQSETTDRIDTTETNAAPPFTSEISSKQEVKNVAPLKAMLFIDGTWLYYSLNTRNPKRDVIIAKFGMGWQNNYKVDWQALPRCICAQIERQRNSKTSFSGSDRPLEISRVMVFTSAKKETDPNSIRMRMFRDMANANYDVYMMETTGQGEKCVDIQLAVEMLHYATVPNAYDVAILLSGDKDFVPALVRTRQKGKQVCISSMRAGCNRVLYESYPHIRDYDVVWLESFLDELIVPISQEERGRRDRAGYASSFTMMRVVRDFVEGAPDHEWVSSRDIGKYLKNIEIGDSNMLEELKQVHGGLRTFLMERGCNLFEVKFPDAGALRGRGEFSFWVRVIGDSDSTLLNEFKRTQFFTKEEKQFLEGYRKEKYVVDDSYEHTTTISNYLEDSEVDSFENKSSPPIDFSQLTVVRLKEICRERGLHVTGNKDALIDRLEQNRFKEHEIIKKNRKELKDAGVRVSTKKTIRPKAIGIATKSPPSLDHLIPAGGNIYASTLPQMDMGKTRNSRGSSTTTDAAVTAHLEALIIEYLTASGGSAGSRDIGRYLAANSDSLKGNRSALSELKENYGSLLAFILSRENHFSVMDKPGRPGNGDDTGFPIKLKKSR